MSWRLRLTWRSTAGTCHRLSWDGVAARTTPRVDTAGWPGITTPTRSSHRARFLGITGCRRTRAHPFELGVRETGDDAAHQRHTVGAHRQQLCERRTRVEVDAQRRCVRRRIVGGRGARGRDRLVEDRTARPGVGDEHETAQRLDEGPLPVRHVRREPARAAARRGRRCPTRAVRSCPTSRGSQRPCSLS